MTDAAPPPPIQTTPTALSDLADPARRRRVALLRLAIGLFHGLALYGLIRTEEAEVWPATAPILFGALLLAIAFTPVVLLAGAGRMRARHLAIWGAVVAAVLAGFAAWAASNRVVAEWESLPAPPFSLLFASVVLLFVAHHLVVPALQARRWIAPYPAYFDTAWKAGVQLVLSLVFVQAFWLLLALGAALFGVIGLTFLAELITKPWFAAPVTTLAFALAVQLTDVRDGLIRGVRTVALMLLGWLLPVMTVLAAGFLVALPFTGLGGLWETGSSTALMLSAAAALIVLINAAYHDGNERPARALAWAVPAAGLLLTPLVALALWGLGIRIGQHGLTPDRIIATACALVGAIYAGGYGWAAIWTLRRRDWMRRLERTNVAAALAMVTAILALFSPVADPARLSVADQLGRLERDVVSAERFDYAFLRFDAGRRGERALAWLVRSDDPEIARRAGEMQAVENRYDLEMPSEVRRRRQLAPKDIRIEAVPGGAALPASFTSQFPRLGEILRDCTEEAPCAARVMDIDSDGREDVLIAKRTEVSVFERIADGRWMEDTTYEAPQCRDGRDLDLSEAWRQGDIETAPARYPDMVLGGVRLRAQGNVAVCPGEPVSPPDPPSVP